MRRGEKALIEALANGCFNSLTSFTWMTARELSAALSDSYQASCLTLTFTFALLQHLCSTVAHRRDTWSARKKKSTISGQR